MYKGFDLRITNAKGFDQFLDYGTLLYEDHKSSIHTELDNLFSGDGVISVSKVKKNWFPSLTANVFISHSHANSEIAIGLAGWLSEKFEISAFIDSCVWGYFSDLQKMIDDRFCKNPNNKPSESNESYEYHASNRVASHVNTILNNSLMRMIDECECIIFINTPESISSKGSAKDEKSTYSPWIYSELEATRLIRRKAPSRPALLEKSLEVRAEAMDRSEPNFEYDDVDLSHLTKLKLGDIQKWNRCDKTGLDALDYLYEHFI
jgi:hypothetical protein